MSIQRPLNVLEDNLNAMCQYHPKSKLIYTCKDCCGVLACSECVTTEHQGHRLARIMDNANEVWNDLIHHYIYKAEKLEIPKVVKEIKIAERKLDENRKHSQELTGDLQKRGEELKVEIDRITLQAIETVTNITHDNGEIIKIYKHQLEKQHSILQETLRKCNQAQQTQDFTLVFPVEKDIRAGLKLPKVPFLQRTAFTPEVVPNVLLDRAFGVVEVLGYKSKIDQLSISADKSAPLSARQPKTTSTDSISYKTLSQFRHVAEINSLTSTTDECSWICNRDKKEVLLVHKSGEVKQTTELDVHIGDISTSPINGNLWFCSEYDYSIRELTTPTTAVVRFRTPFMPRTLSVTSGNRVATATFRKVCVYNSKGEELYTTETSNQANQKVASPVLIKACPMSGNIAVLDMDEQSHGGSGRPHITALTGTLGMLFKYHGNNRQERKIQRPSTARAGKKKSVANQGFMPTDICYDAAGHLFVADEVSRTVVMVSNNGQYLKTVYKDQEFPPRTIGLQTGGLLWVGFDFGIVKVIKYKV